jgi:hypothetical protein
VEEQKSIKYIVYFTKSIRGDQTYYDVSLKENREDTELFLKILKRGIEYEGFYSYDGATWTRLGKHFFLKFKPHPVFWATSWDREYPETPVKVDYFEVREIK